MPETVAPNDPPAVRPRLLFSRPGVFHKLLRQLNIGVSGSLSRYADTAATNRELFESLQPEIKAVNWRVGFPQTALHSHDA